MSNVPTSPYTFGGGSGGSKGPSFGKSVGDAISSISGLKAHRETLEHVASETQKDHERNLEVMRVNHANGETSAANNAARTKSLEAARHKNALAATTGLVKHAQTLSKGAQPGTKMSLKPGSIDFTVGEKPAPAARATKATTTPVKAPTKPRTPKGTK